MQQRLGYVPALDGIRAIAITAVVGSHLFRWPRGGAAGVDLFFVLSGFLITTLLLEERALEGRISLRAFYERRARRLLPALIVMLASFLVIAAVKGLGVWAARSVAEGGFYTSNFVMAFHLGLITRGNPLSPLWSLATEEQFYLLWPLLLLLVARRPQAGDLLAKAAVVAVFLPFVLAVLGASNDRVEFSPDTRGTGELLVGCTIAFALRDGATVAPSFAIIGLAGIIGCLSFGWAWGIVVPVMSLFGGCLIAAVVANPSSRATRLLGARPFSLLGRISYSLYLWNLLILWAFDGRLAGLAAVVAVLVAWASYRFIEQPLRRRRQSSSDGRRLEKAVAAGFPGEVAA